MAIQPCPACARDTTKPLTGMSARSDLTYYRCDSCGHVWVVAQDGRIVHHVTRLEQSAQNG